MISRRFMACCCVLLGLFAITGCSAREIADRIEAEARERVDRNVNEAIESGADRTEEGIRTAVRCVVTDEACIQRAEEQGRDVVLTDDEGNPVTNQPGAANVNFDFVPGERTIFAEDFATDRVGDFPRSLEFESGNFEVAEWNGGRWLRSTGGRFAIPLGETLPDRFTIEFDLHKNYGQTNGVVIYTGDESRQTGTYYESNMFRLGHRHRSGVVAGARAENAPSSTSEIRTMFDDVVTARVMVDDTYAKVYIDEERVANVPNAQIPRDDKLWVSVSATEEGPTYISNIRVAAGGRDLYSVLETEGRVATQGVYFATGSDQIQPESAPTLEEIAQMLRQNPNLNLTIEGHTDSQGDDMSNLELSRERAEAVMEYLVQQHGIDPSRLSAQGRGESQPVASNDTPEGRQQNRRVELVRR